MTKFRGSAEFTTKERRPAGSRIKTRQRSEQSKASHRAAHLRKDKLRNINPI
jgi:hypothetical protein